MADAKSTILRFVEEATFGTTPASSGQIIRVTNQRVTPIIEYARSGEITSTDVVAAYVKVGEAANWSFDFELTVADAEQTALFEGITGGAWTLNSPSTGIDRLQNGTTNYSYTLELENNDITQFKALKGCVIGAMSMAYTPGAIITGSMSGLGALHVDMAGSTVFTGSTAASTVSPIGASAAGLTSVQEGGGASTLLLGFDFTMTRNLTPKRALGSDTAASITRGGLVIEGNVSYDLQDAVLFSKYEDGTSTSFDMVATDGTNTIDFNFPAVTYLTAELGAPGRDGSADVNATWGAADNGSGVMVEIDRTT